MQVKQRLTSENVDLFLGTPLYWRDLTMMWVKKATSLKHTNFRNDGVVANFPACALRFFQDYCIPCGISVNHSRTLNDVDLRSDCKWADQTSKPTHRSLVRCLVQVFSTTDHMISLCSNHTLFAWSKENKQVSLVSIDTTARYVVLVVKV